MGLAAPEEAFIRHGGVVGCSLPLTNQDGAGARQWFGRKLARVVAVAEHSGKQPVEFLGDRLGEPAVQPFLPRIGNTERENVSAQRRGWFLGKLFYPQGP